MDKQIEYTYTKEDYERLEECLIDSQCISRVSPDQYQYHQNKLCREIARFLLKPYLEKREKDA